MRQRVIAAALGIFAGLTLPAFAQQSPSASPSSAPGPKHSCVKPGDFPGNLATDNQRKNWQRSYVEYADCLKKFINDEQAAAEPHIKASNDAINEYNSAVKEYNAQIEKAKSN